MYSYDDPERIKIIDSRMGAGKTSFAIQHINSLSDKTKVIYITPFLDEVKRIINACPEKKFVQPIAKENGTKLSSLIHLLHKGENIASTHALFSFMNDAMVEAIRVNGYVLFLDEVFQTVDRFNISDGGSYYGIDEDDSRDNITKNDVKILIESGLIKINEDNYSIDWVNKDTVLSKYKRMYELAERDLLYLVDGSLLLWTFPIEVFRHGIFDEIFIMTYQFESQLQYYYYKYFDLKYKKYVVRKKEDDYYIIPADKDDQEKQWKEFIKEKIHIVDAPKINKVGGSYRDISNKLNYYSLSKSWYLDKNNTESIKKISRNLDNYFRNITKSKVDDRLWTSFKINKDKIKSRNVSDKSWLQCNARATNDYRNKTILAYLINIFVDPFYDKFFKKKGIIIDQDLYAISNCLQWIFRSAIRDNKDIYIYIPSERMRILLIQWLNDEEISFLKEK